MEVWGGHRTISQSVTTTGLDVWVHSSPPPQQADGHAEDVYLLSSCASGRISRVLLADTSAYGTAVPQLAGELRTRMHETINHVSQDELIGIVNRRFVHTAGLYGFASGLFATYCLLQRTLAVCVAGHPVPLIYRQSQKSWRFLENPAGDICGARSAPLGLNRNARYDSCTTTVEQDDLVFCMTDALTDALTSSGTPIGSGGLRTLLQSQGRLPPQEIIPAVLDTLGRWNAANVHRDRITAMLLRVKHRSVPLKDSLLAPVRRLGHLTGFWPGRNTAPDCRPGDETT